MRTLLLFRGAPGVGKTTFIKENKLETYTLSADNIRLMLNCPSLHPDGKLGISQKKNKEAWGILFSLLEKRMKEGEFTVIDAVNSKTSEISRYVQLAKEYKYRVYLVDMTDIPIDIAKLQNRLRVDYKVVPEKVIDKIYARFETQKVPSGVIVIKPNEISNILYSASDFNNYKKIHMIGDIHGCLTVLKEYLKDGIKEEELYIFTGDYLDRGIENIDTIKYMMELSKLPNVILLEGNHESLPLRNYVHGIDNYPRYFKEGTKKELDTAISSGIIKKKSLSDFYRKLNQICLFKYREKTVLVSHGGVSSFNVNPLFIATEQFIRGIGEYSDYEKCIQAFENNTNENTYQVNGHRNVFNSPIKASERCFNLEGKVEYGGYLRVVTLDENGFKTHEIKNNIFNKEKKPKIIEEKNSSEIKSDEEIIETMRNNPLIKERIMGNISSFNFTRKAFQNKKWNEQTIKARGLFVNNKDNSIVARGYDKWFRIGEREETTLVALSSNMKFPATAYVKENGFLGLISYNKEKDCLMFCTKSLTDDYAEDKDLVNRFKEIYYKTGIDEQSNLINYLKQNNHTLICECVDIENDPHIIEYSSSRIYLLDIVENKLTFNKLPFDQLNHYASEFGLLCKKKAKTFNNYEEFYDWYQEVTESDYRFNGEYIEGFVVEDASQFMIKVKCVYYDFWKYMRGITHSILRNGKINKLNTLYDSTPNHYYSWLKENKERVLEELDSEKINIIELRKKFYEEKVGD